MSLDPSAALPIASPPTRPALRLLVAIPCLNEQDTVGAVILGIPRQLDGIAETAVLVVDDGSDDQSAGIAGKLGAVVKTHPTNRGVGAAFHTALDYALDHDFDLMVNIDGDGQFDAADIAQLLEPILAGRADVALASRFIDPRLVPQMPRAKLWGNRRMSALISRLCGQRFADVSCGFRAYNREALLRINIHGAFTYTQETLLDLSYKQMRIVEVPVRARYFPGRRSRVAGSLLRYAVHTSLIILKFSRDYFPLRFFLGLALLFFLPGVAFGLIFFGHFLMTGRFSPYLFAGFLSGFFFLMSLLLAILALVADMLDRIRVNQERLIYLSRRQGHRGGRG